MEKITPQQFKRWKSNTVGKIFFEYIEENIRANQETLDNLVKNPLSYTQEEYYKRCVEYGTIIKTWKDLLDLKIDYIQGEEDDTVK